jgi:1-acyl-sn-glycerol-3-phosphate acyltransferase
MSIKLMLRFLILNALVFALSVFFSLYGVVLGPFDRVGGRLVHRLVAVPWARMILRVCGVKVVVKGLENVEADVPRIYLSNHQSYFDIFALLACLPVSFKFVLKQELMKIPFLGSAMRNAGYIAIDREDPRKAIKSMNAAAERIKNGASVLIFPEGTRSADGQLLPFKPGGFHLALKSKCDVVPMAIVNSRSIVPKGSLTINKGTFAMNIGKPIPTKGYSKKDMAHLMDRVREEMMGMMSRTL